MPEYSHKKSRGRLVQTIGPLITLTMPTVQFGLDRRQNIIELKHLLRVAEQMLGTPQCDNARAFLEPAPDLSDSEALFQRSGLVIILSTDLGDFRYNQVEAPSEVGDVNLLDLAAARTTLNDRTANIVHFE